MRGIAASGSDQIIDDIAFLDNPDGPTCSGAIYVGSWVGTGNVINNVRVDGYHLTGYDFISASGVDIKVTNCVLLNITFIGESNLTAIYVNGNVPTGLCPDLLVAKNVVGHITHSELIDGYGYCRAIDAHYVAGATVRNNLIFDFENKYTDGWTWGMDCHHAVDMTVEHNAISGITGPDWVFALEVTNDLADPSGVTHRNHIITDLTVHNPMDWRWAYVGKWGDDLPVDYSCAWNVGHAFDYSAMDVIEGDGFIEENPQFIDPANDDYRVSPGSPASGTAHDGTDMGAYGGPDPLTWLPD
jgi:hypothetical protein